MRPIRIQAKYRRRLDSSIPKGNNPALTNDSRGKVFKFIEPGMRPGVVPDPRESRIVRPRPDGSAYNSSRHVSHHGTSGAKPQPIRLSDPLDAVGNAFNILYGMRTNQCRFGIVVAGK